MTNARRFKKAIYGALVVAGLSTTWVVARAITSPSKQAQLKTQREVTVQALRDAIARGDDGIGALPTDFVVDDDETQEDDAELRSLWLRLNDGPSTQDSVVNLLKETAVQRQREHAYRASAQKLADAGGPSPTPATTLQWSQLGPQSALSEYNGGYYPGLDSGRVATVRADPANPATVYIGAIGGGIWKTPDITVNQPAWTPLTDSLGTMFIGSFDLDPTNSNIIHAGLGDYWEGNPGGVMVSTTDGGATWGTPKPLTVTLGGATVKAVNVRTVRVDPNDHNNILAAADVGLFRSTDGGATYNLIDLPNLASYGTVLEGGFSIVYTGQTAGKSTFLVSGTYACPGAVPSSFAQGVGFVAKCPTLANGLGSLGDIWKSVDGGATWTSLRVAGVLPNPLNGAMGRINLSAVPGAASPDTAVIYGLAAAENGGQTVAVIKSIDGGATWSVSAQGKNTAPSNPLPGAFGNDCITMDIGHGQSSYDLTIAVDPGDPNSVLVGGNLCGARSSDGGATWQMMSHWLAFADFSNPANGAMPYVHADWHASLITRVAGKPIALAGSDGGIFVSFDVFSEAHGSAVQWFDANVGLDTVLPYSIGSGDPSYGTGGFALAGLQDNGSRYRVSPVDLYNAPFPKAWNQIDGGDGFGTAVASDTKGTNVTTWAVANGRRAFCRPSANLDCSRATRIINGGEQPAWEDLDLPLPSGDSNSGFGVRFASLYDDAGSVISNSLFNLWKISITSGNVPVITRLVTSPAPADPGGYFGCGSASARQIRAGGPVASPFTYTINGTPSRVYGLPLTGGCFAVVIDSGDPSGVVSVVGAKTALQVGAEQPSNTSSITFPRDPTHLGGTDITQTYVVSSVADFLVVPATTPPTPVSAATGHVFLTTDGGATWTPLHGNGTGFDLPNVRTYVVKFDPSDPTDQTLFAGTDLGLYRSTDLGQTWTRYGDNLPMVRVQDLFISQNGSLIRVAMYGRGVWEIQPRADGAGGALGKGDFDKDGVIDFRDVANLANRLSQTPVPTGPPFYDSEMNLTEAGATTTVNDSDLAALLAKFGGAP